MSGPDLLLSCRPAEERIEERRPRVSNLKPRIPIAPISVMLLDATAPNPCNAPLAPASRRGASH